MQDFLQSISARRKSDAEVARRSAPLDRLLAQAAGRVHHGLAGRLRDGSGLSVIAEVKKASPSAGVLVPNYQPGRIAVEYEQAGAVGISVLTEPHSFQGAAEHLVEVRGAVTVPVLRKDFITDTYQIAEAAAWGADVVLLIVAALSPESCRELHGYAAALGLETLVEVHDRAELEVASSCEGALIGVNSRNLRTLRTDLAVACEMAEWLPRDRIAIAESGIRTHEDLLRLAEHGYRGFLVGETLVRSADPGAVLRALVHGTRGTGETAG